MLMLVNAGLQAPWIHGAVYLIGVGPLDEGSAQAGKEVRDL